MNSRELAALVRAYEEIRARYAVAERQLDELASRHQQLQELFAEQRARAEQAGARSEALRRRVAELEVGGEALDAVVRERDALRAQLAELESRPRLDERAPPLPEAPATDDRLTRLAADLQNLRRRRDEEVALARGQERDRLLGELVGVADLLDAALAANPDRESVWAKGHEGLVRQVASVLAREGLERVGEVGERFDPHVYEALAMVPGGEPNVVQIVERPGYRYAGGSLLRPARVVVGAGSAGSDSV